MLLGGEIMESLGSPGSGPVSMLSHSGDRESMRDAKVDRMFGFWDLDQDGYWKYDEAAKAQRDTDNTELGESDWVGMCKYLEADPTVGLTSAHVKKLYSEGTEVELDRDYDYVNREIRRAYLKSSLSPRCGLSFDLPPSPSGSERYDREVRHALDNVEEVKSHYGSSVMHLHDEVDFLDTISKTLIKLRNLDGHMEAVFPDGRTRRIKTLTYTEDGGVGCDGGLHFELPVDDRLQIEQKMRYIADVTDVPHNIPDNDEVSVLRDKVVELEEKLSRAMQRKPSHDRQSQHRGSDSSFLSATLAVGSPTHAKTGTTIDQLHNEMQNVMGTADRLLTTLQSASPSPRRSPSVGNNTTKQCWHSKLLLAMACRVAAKRRWDELGSCVTLSSTEKEEYLTSPIHAFQFKQCTGSMISVRDVVRHGNVHSNRRDVGCVWTVSSVECCVVSVLKKFTPVCQAGLVVESLLVDDVAAGRGSIAVSRLPGVGFIVTGSTISTTYRTVDLVSRSCCAMVAALSAVGGDASLLTPPVPECTSHEHDIDSNAYFAVATEEFTHQVDR